MIAINYTTSPHKFSHSFPCTRTLYSSWNVVATSTRDILQWLYYRTPKNSSQNRQYHSSALAVDQRCLHTIRWQRYLRTGQAGPIISILTCQYLVREKIPSSTTAPRTDTTPANQNVTKTGRPPYRMTQSNKSARQKIHFIFIIRPIPSGTPAQKMGVNIVWWFFGVFPFFLASLLPFTLGQIACTELFCHTCVYTRNRKRRPHKKKRTLPWLVLCAYGKWQKVSPLPRKAVHKMNK